MIRSPVLCIILLETLLIGVPFSRRGKASISIDDEFVLRKIIENEFLGNENFPFNSVSHDL
jgi:hypothetical protein